MSLRPACRLQIETWGYDASDVIPRKAFLVVQKIGGQVIGAFDTDLPGAGRQRAAPESLVGFAMSLPGVKTGFREPRSLICTRTCWPCAEGTATAALARNSSWNSGLKRFAAVSGYMEWTFDPLEIKNAHLNIHKLGAIVRRYHVNFYGVSSSRLQGGLPTDRLVAEWHLDSPRVHAMLEAALRHRVHDRRAHSGSGRHLPVEGQSSKDRDRALAVQLENRSKFQEAFAQGLAVLGFVRDAEGNGVFELGSPTTRRRGGDGLKKNHQSSETNLHETAFNSFTMSRGNRHL